MSSGVTLHVGIGMFVARNNNSYVGQCSNYTTGDSSRDVEQAAGGGFQTRGTHRAGFGPQVQSRLYIGTSVQLDRSGFGIPHYISVIPYWKTKHQTCPPLLDGGKPQMLIGTGGIFVFEQIVRKALAKAGLKLPSSLVSMVAAFVLLKVRRHCCCSRCASMPCYLWPDSIARKFRELS